MTANEGALLRGIVSAEREDRMLLDGPAWPHVLDAIARAAESRGCSALAGASEAGNRLVGALLVSRPGAFHVWAPGSRERVMTVEGVAAGDAALRRAMRQALSSGAEAAFGVVIAPSEYHLMVDPAVVDVVERSAA